MPSYVFVSKYRVSIGLWYPGSDQRHLYFGHALVLYFKSHVDFQVPLKYYAHFVWYIELRYQ